LDINENYGVSLNEVRNQLHDLNTVHYDAKLKKVNFPTNKSFTPELLFAETCLLDEDENFDRNKSKSCRSEGHPEKRVKTPVQQYDPFNMEPFLLLVGGKPRKPVFKRTPITTIKVHL
jgi:hypothetical protein